jgi:hypothetical protein
MDVKIGEGGEMIQRLNFVGEEVSVVATPISDQLYKSFVRWLFRWLERVVGDSFHHKSFL